jgi:hypothetical protein
MKICDTINDLVCYNCIYSNDLEHDGVIDCFKNLDFEGKGDECMLPFCGEGEWALTVTTEDYHYEEGHHKIVDNIVSSVKVLPRGSAIQVLLNDGVYDWL